MDNRPRITVRLDEDVFRRYEVIRATRGEKWQTVIERLLAEWADGPAPEPRPSPRAEMDPVVLAIAELLSKPGNVEKLRAILLTFVNQQGQNSP